MRQHLVSILLFKWTKPENRERPAIPAPAPADATAEQAIAINTSVALARSEVSRWEQGHELAVNTI